MRVVLDTNVLISAGVFAGSIAGQALSQLLESEHEVLVPQYCVDEALEVAGASSLVTRNNSRYS
jgi:predicted nucleic acid-binding protein